MNISDIIRTIVAGSAAGVQGASRSVDVVATPNNKGGWNIEANGRTEELSPGGRIPIGDTLFLSDAEGNLVTERDGQQTVYPRPSEEAGPTPSPTTTATTTTTTTTSTTIPATSTETSNTVADAPESVNVPVTMPAQANAVPVTMPPNVAF